jgi:hypothetical protein
MSHAEYASKPVPVFTKLAVMLRNFPAVQLVIAKFAALLRRDRGSGEPLISKFLGAAPSVNRNTVDHVAILKSSRDLAIPTKSNDDQSEREKLIRRRWAETGIKMWNPNVHGAGHAALQNMRSIIGSASTDHCLIRRPHSKFSGLPGPRRARDWRLIWRSR